MLSQEMEVEVFFEEAGLEADEKFRDDAERIKDAVIAEVQEMADSLDAYKSAGKRAQTKRTCEDVSFGTMLRDALEGIDVDVDGMITFLEEKGYELEQMQISHEEEVEAFFEEAGLEAEAEFTDDVERIKDAVIA